MSRDPYHPHSNLVDPARAHPELWRLGLGIGLIWVIAYALGQTLLLLVQALLSDDAYLDFLSGLSSGESPGTMLFILFSLGALAIGTGCAAELIHRRSALQLLGPIRTAIRQFTRVIAALALLHVAVMILPPWGALPSPEPGLALGIWLTLLPISLTALMIQVASEEVLFRGYLQQQIAARWRHPALWLAVPSALFALGHYAPDAFGENAVVVTLWAFLFGLAMGDLTARSGTLGPAIAVHFANNILALLVVSLQGDLSGLALYVLPFGPEDTEALTSLMPLDFAMIGLSWLAARLALRV